MNDMRLGLGQMGIVATVIQHATNSQAYKVTKPQQAKAVTALASWNARAVAAGYADAQAWLDAGPARPSVVGVAARLVRLSPEQRERYLANRQVMIDAGMTGSL